ncbi:hypothetical protein bcgnr5369_68410 [Bacillus cereus]
MLLTGFGIYDRFGQFAGAGTAVPVTGFGNSVIAACIEHRTEGCYLVVEFLRKRTLLNRRKWKSLK